MVQNFDTLECLKSQKNNLNKTHFFLLLKFPFIYICLRFAGVAQLVERQPSKLNVASSNLVSRSKASLQGEAFFI